MSVVAGALTKAAPQLIGLIPAAAAPLFFQAATAISIALEGLGGLLFLVGMEGLGGKLIALFLLLVTPVVHVPGMLAGDQNEVIAVLKNVALLGACLVAIDTASKKAVKSKSS